MDYPDRGVPPPEVGGSRGVPTHPAPLESSASHHSIHSLVTESNGLSGRELCRAVLTDIEKRRLSKRPVPVKFDGLEANRRRAHAALRVVAGDPDMKVDSRTSPRYSRPSTGLRANGFREGYQCCAAAVAEDLRDLYAQIPPGAGRDAVADLGRRFSDITSADADDLVEAA